MYTQESRFEEDTCNLYTHIGVAHIKYYGLKCNMNKCQKKFIAIYLEHGACSFTPTQFVLPMKLDGISSTRSKPAKSHSLGSAMR